MKLSETCIRQPVLAIVLSLVLILVGILGFKTLELRFFPKLEVPVVTISTYYQGASSDLMESQVTTPIEDALAGLDNVESISSRSSSQWSSVTVLFRLGSDFESEVSNIRDKISGLGSEFPQDANTPTIRVGSNGSPVLGIGFIDKKKSTAEIRNYVEKVIKPQLRQVHGVGGISILGASDFAMRIWLDASKMAARGVTVSDVKSALTANNIYFPAGSFQGTKRNYSIVSQTQLQTAEAFSNIIIRHSENGTIRFKDISKVELGNRSLYDAPMRVNGQNGLELMIEPLQEANPIDVANLVKARMKDFYQVLPTGMSAKINYDTSIFLQTSIDETFMAILEAIILVIFVIFLFLGSFRAALIPIITIPVSLIAVFAVMNFLGFSINTMSLLAIVLAIGLVVDDAIVVLENIHRHIEGGTPPLQAALLGSKEIGSAVIAMSITLAAVYAPIGFIQGFTAELFKEFAFTLAAAVLISAFVALTLSPMMCSKILLTHNQEGRYLLWLERTFERVTNSYQRILALLIKKRRYVTISLLAIMVIGAFVYQTLPTELIPKEDVGFIQVSVQSPSGASLDYTVNYVDQVEKVINSEPAISGVISQVSTSSANIRLTLKPWGERKKTTGEIIKSLNAQFADIPGVDASAFQPDITDYGDGGSDIEANFMTSGEYTDLVGSTSKLVSLLKKYPGVTDVHTNLKFDAQQYAITINRDLAAVSGVDIQDIADTVRAMMSGNHWTDVQSGTQSYDVLVQMQKKDLQNFNALDKLYVHSGKSSSTDDNPQLGMIPVSSLVTLTPIVGQGTLTHFNRFRSGTVTARLAAGYSEGDAIKYINQHIGPILNTSIQFSYSGPAQQFIDSAGSMTGIMAMSIIFIYLVLAAQFGSFIDPFIILLTVPLSIVGAFIALKLSGGTVSIYSQIGFVTLIGMVSKHGILITQFVNGLRKEGVEFTEAIIKGSALRLRPILMTTAAMVFGTLPLALASGPGSIGRQQIGWVIVGGLVVGTFFSLIVVPIAYSFFGKAKKV